MPPDRDGFWRLPDVEIRTFRRIATRAARRDGETTLDQTIELMIGAAE
jgi:hypothetical protein